MKMVRQPDTSRSSHGCELRVAALCEMADDKKNSAVEHKGPKLFLASAECRKS
jgi:hypothetical protein